MTEIISRTLRRWLLPAIGLALLSVACFAFPMYVLYPFHRQGATELRIALFVRQVAPLVSTACAALVFMMVVLAWRRIRGAVRRMAMVLTLLVAVGGAWLARRNVFELRFRPIGTPEIARIGDAHINADDMVLAVRIDGLSRAYPIRELAYHHIVNDWLGGKPIASTY